MSQTKSQTKSNSAGSRRQRRRRLANDGRIPVLLGPSVRRATPRAPKTSCVKGGALFEHLFLLHPLLGHCEKTAQEILLVELKFSTTRLSTRIGTFTPLPPGN
mmetsp:Transcript_3130/g.9127  ORF Transcript_3130/g.9127 Transcript_3130/m.9127 type:complete len:103 (-) Transcript_3130:46-354(-)